MKMALQKDIPFKGVTVDNHFKECGHVIRKSLQKLFDLVVNKKISKVIIEHRDRLTRFQFKVFEYFFKSHDVEIVVIEKKSASVWEQ